MAGFFGLFDYSKPGKGVRKDEPRGSRFVYFWKLFFRKFWRLSQLNLLYMLFIAPFAAIAGGLFSLFGLGNGTLFASVLLIVIGAYGPANAGFTYVLRNLANEQPVFMFSDFWDAFKANWRQSLIYGILMAFASVILVVSVQFYNANSATHAWMFVPSVICLFIGLILVLMSFYVTLMIITLDLPLRSILKNAAILAVLCLKTNLLTLLFTGLLVAACVLFFPITLLFVVVAVPAWIGFIVSYNSYPGIKKYAIDPFLARQEEAETAANQSGSLFNDEEQKRD